MGKREMAGLLGTGGGEEEESEAERLCRYTAWEQNLKKQASWRVPGPDGINSFWLKAFRGPTTLLKGLLFRVMEGRDRMPDWLVRGRTVLIPKVPNGEWRADKYR